MITQTVQLDLLTIVIQAQTLVLAAYLIKIVHWKQHHNAAPEAVLPVQQIVNVPTTILTQLDGATRDQEECVKSAVIILIVLLDP